MVPEDIHTPPRRALLFKSPHPPEFPSQEVLVIPPPPPGISVVFQIGWIPSGKNIYVKNDVALYYYAKDIFFCDKMRKNLSKHVNT